MQLQRSGDRFERRSVSMLGSGGVRTGAWSSFENNKVGNPLFARMNILEMFKICFCYIC